MRRCFPQNVSDHVMPHVRSQHRRLRLHVLAYNLGKFMRTLAMPKAVEP